MFIPEGRGVNGKLTMESELGELCRGDDDERAGARDVIVAELLVTPFFPFRSFSGDESSGADI